MYKYIGLYYPDGDPREHVIFPDLKKLLSITKDNWRKVYDGNGLLLFDFMDNTSGMQSHTLDEERGVILGHIFTPKPDGSHQMATLRAPKVFSCGETKKILLSNCQSLIDNYWGSFISFVRSEDNNSITVFRSPFSNIHCFYFKLDGAYILFSDVEMFDLLRPHGLSVDWDFASIYLKNSYTITNRTALNGLKLLQHSQALCIDNKKEEVKYLWNPLDYCNQKDNRCLEEIQFSLKNVTVSCFDAWSRIFNRGMVRLSGGLDSSLVAGIMSRLPNRPHIVCVTHYDGSPLNDERAYARLTSEYTGYALKEIEVNPGLCDFHYYENFSKMPWPFMIGTNWGSLTEELSISDKYRLGVRINGEGGDVLFGFMRDNFAAKDYYYDNGFNLKFLKVAMNSAIVSDTSLWETLIESRHSGRVRARYFPEKENKYSWGINPSIVEKIDNLVSDTLWKSSHLRAPPSKKIAIGALMWNNEYFNPAPEVNFLEPLSPLLSQPIVENCLRIPLYIHQLNGKERGLARRVFAEFLADPVRLRQFKSNGSPFYLEMISTHRKYFLRFLLDGVLAQKNFLNTSEIEKVMMDPSCAKAEHYIRISHLANVEAWARAWS